MWEITKHGLYKQFVFQDFKDAWSFMQRVSAEIDRLDHHPRWQNEWNVVEIWLSTHEEHMEITDLDRELSNIIDTLVSPSQNNSLVDNDAEKTTHITEVQLYADGGSRGNPGPSASGFVLLDMADREVLKNGEYIGVTTNNQAEYQALKLGLEAALIHFQSREVHVYMDSMLVVNQMKRIFKVKNRELWPIHDAIMAMLPKFQKVSFDHVPRELNKIADAEVNKALDETLKGQ
jgi:ribonuclease HI